MKEPELPITIVVPAYNEEESLPELDAWIKRVLVEHGLAYEVIYIDDGSADATWEKIEAICADNPSARGIKFRRNYGKSAAVNVGFEASRGRVVFTMDADLQDSPEEVPEMYRMITEDGFDIVSGWKKKRHDPLSKTIPSKLYNAVTRLISGIPLHDFNCGLKAYRYQVVKSIEVYGEMHRYIPMIAKAEGFKKIGEKVVQHQARKYGISKFGWKRYITGFLDLLSVTFVGRFGKAPMHFFGTIGTLFTMLGLVILVYLSIAKLVYTEYGIADRPLFYFGILALIIGTQLFVTGFLAELVARSAPNRNNYLVEEENRGGTPMKSVVLLSPAHPLRGGIASSTERLAQEFQAYGYSVEVWSFKYQYPGFLFPGKTQYSDDPAPEDLRILPLVHSLNPFNWLRIGRKLKKKRPDLVVVRYWLPFMAPALGSILRLARRNRHTKVVCIADNIIPHEKRPGDNLLTRYFVPSVDAFIGMSRAVADQIRTFSPRGPVAFSPHPLYDNYGAAASKEQGLKELNLDPDYKYLLFFGFIRDYKGLDLLLEAMADSRVQDMPLRLIVAGEYYSNEAKYEALIDQLGIRDQLILHTRYIPKEAVRYYFAAADLVAQPYRSATVSGISQMAYFYEVPMIVTAVGGLPEIVPHGLAGYVVDVDPKAIADSIVDFFGQERLEEMRKGVIAQKERFGWGAMVETIARLGKEIGN